MVAGRTTTDSRNSRRDCMRQIGALMRLRRHMALIKHNTREGDRTPGHFAHDTTRADTGTYVNGRTDPVRTTRSNPCPQCGGWGELIEIDKLARDVHPVGSKVEVFNIKHNQWDYSPGPLAGTWEGGEGSDVEPEITGAWIEATGAPVVVEDEPVHPTYTVPVKEDIAPSVDKTKAANALGDLLSAFMPDSDKIEQDIALAVDKVKNDMRLETQQTVSAGILILEENFKQAVEAIVAPKTIVIENRNVPDGEPKTIMGAHSAFEKCLKWMLARDGDGHPMNLYLIGPAGCGKTTLAKQLAEALSVSYYTTGQVLGEHQVTGFVDAGGSYHATPFQHSFVNGGLWLGDEFDGWSPEAALAMNGALANGHGTFPNSVDPQVRHNDWYCVVAGNTWGKGADRQFVGRNQMDEASLDRFISIEIDYDRELESRLAQGQEEYLHYVWTARDRARELKMRRSFGTRAIIKGVAALNNGIDMKEVVSVLLRQDMEIGEWQKLGVAA
jgi:cobaltochelatase CobS